MEERFRDQVEKEHNQLMRDIHQYCEHLGESNFGHVDFFIDSREVAEMVEKEHKNLIRDIRGYIEILNQSNFEPVEFFIKSEYTDSKGESRPCYLVTRKGCEMVANKLTGAKGVQFTAAYINRFHEMEAAIKFNVPKTLPEALRLAADLADENMGLTAQIEELKPKAEFFEAVADSKDAIDIGCAAKVLNIGIGRNKLFEILRDKEVLMENNLPYQKYIDRGYFRTIEQKYSKPDGSTHINIKTLVYQKGLEYIRQTIER